MKKRKKYPVRYRFKKGYGWAISQYDGLAHCLEVS